MKSGYQLFKHRSIASGKKEEFVLRPRHNESLNHLFFVYDIAEFLEKKKIKFELYTTRMPDIVFGINGKTIAIEVETGTVLSNMKKFREKLFLLNRNYGKNWHFVVTNRNLIKKYRKLGKVIDPRFIKFNINKIIKKG